MEQSILELVLNYYRSPSQYPELVDVDAPLPPGIDMLLDFVAGKTEINVNELHGDLAEVSVEELKAAAVFYIEHAFFNSKANFYRTLGLNSNATQNQIRDHYKSLIHILCLDQDDKAAQWDEAYAMRINRAYSVLRIPEKREKYNSKHNIVVSGFAGVEKRNEPRKVLDGNSEKGITEIKSRIDNSFIATNIDRAYLTKDPEDSSKDRDAEEPPQKIDSGSAVIDSASPDSLYEQHEPDDVAATDMKEDEKQPQERESKPATAVSTETVTVANDSVSSDKHESRMVTYSLLGGLLLVAISIAVIYFSENLETTVSEPVAIVKDSDMTTALTEEESDEHADQADEDSSEIAGAVKAADVVDESKKAVSSEQNTEVKKDDVDVITAKKEETKVSVDEEKIVLLEDEVTDEPYQDDPDVSVLTDEKESEAAAVSGEEATAEIVDVESNESDFEIRDESDSDTARDDMAADESGFTDSDLLVAGEGDYLGDEALFDDAFIEDDDVSDENSESADLTASGDEEAITLESESFSAVVRDFVRYYDEGDLDRLMALFAEDAKTDDREDISGIREDYADAFNLTVKRKFLIDDVQWIITGGNGLGTASFVLFIQALGEDRFAEYTGEITFYIENRDDELLITGLYYQYSE